MTPILYAANETNFNKNFGLGTLPDCTSCVVTEERNGVYELEFSYPITGQNYAELSPDRIVKVKPNEKSDPQLFRIYRNSKPINGIVKFYCQHISYDLNTMVVMPRKLTGVPGRAAMKYILSNCITTNTRPNRFSVGTVTVGNGTLNIREPSPARKCLGGMEGSLLDGFHGEFEFDNFIVNLRESRGQDTGVTILYGKNLTDITSETSIADTYTSVCPYYRNDDETVNTIKSKNMFPGNYNPVPSSTISYMRLNVGNGEFTLFTDMPLRQNGYTNLFILPGDVSTGANTNNNGVWFGHPRTVTASEGYVTIAYRSESGISPADYSVVLVDGDLSAVENRGTNIDPTKITKSLIMLDGAENYGSERTLPLDLTEKFVEEEEYSTVKLIEKANAYIRKSDPGKIRQNIEISFAPLWQTEEYKDYALLERVGLCDTVTVKYEALGVSAKAKVIKTVYNVLSERYIKIELGDVRSNFATTLLELNENLGDLANTSVNKSAMQRAIENATRLITGAEGGYVYISNQVNYAGETLRVYDPSDKNADDSGFVYRTYDSISEELPEGEPGEILIMDKPTKEQATKMWRWNLGGLGYSKNGYSGPFETAITMDGAIVCNFLTAGELNAGVITAGILQDEQGKNYWNLNTGEFWLSAETRIGEGDPNDPRIATESTVSRATTQTAILRSLTNNWKEKGIYLQDGHLYISANAINTGIIVDKEGFNYWDLDTGEFRLSPNAKLSSGETLKNYVSNIAFGKVSDAETEFLRQEKIFYALTGGDNTQGIFMARDPADNKLKLYLNATYIKTGSISANYIQTGILKSTNNVTKLNMDTGSIDITTEAIIDENGNSHQAKMSLSSRGIRLIDDSNQIVGRLVYASITGNNNQIIGHGSLVETDYVQTSHLVCDSQTTTKNLVVKENTYAPTLITDDLNVRRSVKYSGYDLSLIPITVGGQNMYVLGKTV